MTRIFSALLVTLTAIPVAMTIESPVAAQPNGAAAPVAVGAITGRVVFAELDEPLGGVEVVARGSDREWRVLAQDDGTFLFDALPQGEYVVELADTSLGAAPADVTLATDTVEVVLRIHSEVIAVEGRYRSRADQLRQSAEAVQVVETEKARQQSADLGEVLARQSGVNVSRAGGLGSATRFSLGGLADDQVRFFLDGVPLDLAGFPFGVANVPVNLIERVEIYSGVVPVRFGADALGGAVNLVSAELGAGTRAAASYQGGSFGTHRLALGGSRRLGASGLYARGHGFVDLAENDYPVEVEVPDDSGRIHIDTVPRFHDGYRAAGAGLELGWADVPWAERLFVRGFASGYRKEIQHDPVMVVPYGDVHAAAVTAGASLHLRRRFGTGTLLDVAAGYTHGQVTFVDVGECIYDWYGECFRNRAQPGEIEGIARDRVIWSDSVYAIVTAERVLADAHRLRLSISPKWARREGDERRQRDPDARDPLAAERDLVTLVAGLEYELDALGERVENIAFVKDYLQAASSIMPLPSGEWERHDRTSHHLGVGNVLRYRFAEWLWGKASYERATRLPRVDEVFGDGVLVEENVDLAPEVSHNVNLGVAVDARKTRAGDWRLGATGFVRDANQMIKLVGASVFYRYQNVLAARALGVEVSGGWTSPGALIAVEVNGTYQDFRNTSHEGPFAPYAGDRIPNRPWLHASGSARLAWRELVRESDEVTVSWTSRYVHEFFRSWESLGASGTKLVIPSQLVHSIGITYAVPGAGGMIAASLEAQNVTGERIYDFFGVQRPGRAVFFKTLVEL